MTSPRLSGDDATQRLANGITEDIITDLARFRDLDVIAKNSTEIYKEKAIDVREVGNELGVRYVLEGSIQRQDDQLRVTAQLIDAPSGTHVWSERWNRPAEDLFAVQAEVAERIASSLGGYGLIAEAERTAARRKPPENLTAYELYLLGVEATHKLTEKSLQEAIRLLRRENCRGRTCGR
jgi:TolB-like protein